MMSIRLMCLLIVTGLAVGAQAQTPEVSPPPPEVVAPAPEVGIAPSANPAPAHPLPPGFDPQRHMLVGEVEPGMIGYGMSVFHGTTPEPFDVEVVSVEPGNSPGKSVVWIRCPGDRMQLSGPVHGMSGSPIYLWPRGSRRSDVKIGRDARLIGAFAYGFEFGKDCYVGVQPIEQMLAAATRAKAPQPGESGTSVNHDNALSLALAAADRLKWPESTTWRMKAIAQLADVRPAASQLADARSVNWRGSSHTTMALPLSVGSPAAEAMLQPLLTNTGLTAVAGGAGQAMGGPPPRWIDPAIKPQPGGVLAVPIASGDADMSVSGTITDIIERNGKQVILAFGHAFTGQGAENLPMATGYVHFIQPSVQSSFKLGGTLRVYGALVNDENVGVMGLTGESAPMHPATVEVRWPDPAKNHVYHFELAEHPTYTPMVAAATILRSLTSDTAWPDHSTIRLTSDIDFGEGHVLHIDQLLPEPAPRDVMGMLLPAISVLTDSEFGKMPLKAIRTTVEVLPTVMAAQISNVVIQQTSVKPGESVNIDVELHPFQGEPYSKRISFPIPADQPEGQYVMFVGGADAFLHQQLQTHPHWTRITDQKELFGMVQYVMGLDGRTMYASLISQDRPDVAVGRTELDKLPSSRAAMLLQPTNSLATPFVSTLDRQTPMPQVVVGDFSFPVIIEKQPGNVKPKQ